MTSRVVRYCILYTRAHIIVYDNLARATLISQYKPAGNVD